MEDIIQGWNLKVYAHNLPPGNYNWNLTLTEKYSALLKNLSRVTIDKIFLVQEKSDKVLNVKAQLILKDCQYLNLQSLVALLILLPQEKP